MQLLYCPACLPDQRRAQRRRPLERVGSAVGRRLLHTSRGHLQGSNGTANEDEEVQERLRLSGCMRQPAANAQHALNFRSESLRRQHGTAAKRRQSQLSTSDRAGQQQQHHHQQAKQRGAAGPPTCMRSLLASRRGSMEMGAEGAAPGISGRGRPAAQALGRGAAAPAAAAPLAAPAPGAPGCGASRTTAPYLSSSSIWLSSMATPRSSSMCTLAMAEWSPRSISAAMRAASAMLILDLLHQLRDWKEGTWERVRSVSSGCCCF